MPEVLVSFAHCIGDQVVFCPFNFDNPLFAVICGIHSYGAPERKDEHGKRMDGVSKKKYDLELHGPAAKKIRIYNVEGDCVHSTEEYYRSIEGQEFRIASQRLRKFMQDYPNPHASVIVTSEGAELLEGVIAAPNHLAADATDTP